MIKRYLFIVVIFLLPVLAFAEEEVKIALATAPINTSDVVSIKRGGKFFAANCMSCHTMIYLRYNRLAEEVGVTYDKMPVNVKNWPNNVVPPDLSLEADARGVDWIYTYLHSFYQDPSRPSGINNLLVPNTSMPGILVPFQGIQVMIKGRPPTILFHRQEWYNLLVLQKQGSMTPQQFDETIADLVNFFNYAAHPYEARQHWIGWWVLGFLVILFILTFYLKKEYWKDVKKPH